MTKNSTQKFKNLENDRAFTVKYKPFPVSFKGFPVAKNCLKPESVPLSSSSNKQSSIRISP